MSENQFRKKGSKGAKKKKGWLSSSAVSLSAQQWLGGLAKLNLEDTPPVRYLPHLLWTLLLGVSYIGIKHSANRTVVQLNKLKTKIEDMRVDYTTLKSEYMYMSQQSEVAKRVKDLGLKESKHPPHKIVIREDEEY